MCVRKIKYLHHLPNLSKSSSLSHPQVTWGDYVFVPVPTPLRAAAAADSCSYDNFRTTFHIAFIFGMIDGPDL